MRITFDNAAPITVTTAATLSGVKASIHNLELTLAPNPAQTHVDITWPDATSLDYQLLNAIGQQVASGTLRSGRDRLVLSELPAGLYLLHINGESWPISKVD